MTSARDAFVEGIGALRDACSQQAVTAGNPTGQFMRRGLTVAAFNLLETYISDRWFELSDFINAGHVQFLDLPERLQKRAISRTISVARDRTRRSGMGVSDMRQLSASVGESLASVSANLQLSPFTWLWEGSNISAGEYEASLRFIHVGRVFESILSLSQRLGFPVHNAGGGKIDLKQDFQALATERHSCAHQASYPVTAVWLRAVPDRLLRYAVCFDIFSSLGSYYLRIGHQPFLSDDSWLTPGAVNLRFVRERPKDFGEYVEGGVKPRRVDKDGDALFRAAFGRAKPLEVVVKQDISGLVQTWAIQSVS